MAGDGEIDYSRKTYVIQTKDSLTCDNFQTLSYKDIAYYSSVQSRIHGYPNILKNTGYVKRIIWLVACLTITAVFLYTFGQLVIQYHRHEVQTVREVIHARELLFPGVTLCNTNPIKKSKLNLSETVSSVVENIQQQADNDGGASVTRKRRKRALSDYNPCTTDFNTDTGSCFWHVSSNLDAVAATVSCASQSIGGHLAKVPSADVKNFLINNGLFAGTNHILIGLTDAAVEDTYLWHDGSPAGWDDWAMNFPVSTDTSRNCVIYNNQDTREWEDTSCSSAHHYLCEMDAYSPGGYQGNHFYNGARYRTLSLTKQTGYGNQTMKYSAFDLPASLRADIVVLGFCLCSSSPPPDSQCQTENYGASNSCFWFVAVDRTFEAAAEQCAAYDGRLAVIDSEDTKTFIETNLDDYFTKSFWIGLSDEVEEGNFFWTEGSSVTWTDWSSQPYTSEPTADCVQYEVDGTNPLVWAEVSCTAESYFLCEYVYPTAGDSRCTTAYNSDSSSCFWGVTSLATAADAQANCVEYGARLAKVNTEDIRNFLVNQNILPVENGVSWLVGLSDSDVEDSFVWSDGSSLDWEDWLATSTNNDDADCAAYMYSSELVHKLEHISCTDYVQYICEYVQNSSVTTSSSTQESTGSTETVTDSTGIPSYLPWSDLPDREPEREDFKQESDIIEVLADEELSIKEQLGYSLDELVLDCEFDQDACYRNFGYFYDNKYGNCFVFNALTVEEQYITSSIQGDSHGLSLLVYIKQSEYIEGVSNAAGAIVVIHPQSDMPFPEDQGILAKPGHVTSIGMKKLRDERLGDQYSDCEDSPEGDLTNNVFEEHYNVNYSLKACYNTCYQRLVIETCGCADPMYPMAGQAFAGFTGSSCKNRDLYEDNCKYYISQLYATGELQCDCPDHCIEETFGVVTTYAKWPAEVHHNSLRETYPDILGNVTGDYLENNILRIEVYYEDINYLLHEQYPKYTGGRLLSDIGGIMSLLLGCTVFTLSEVVVLLMDLTLVAFCKTKLYIQTRKTPGADEKSHFGVVFLRVKNFLCCVKPRIDPTNNGVGATSVDPNTESVSEAGTDSNYTTNYETNYETSFTTAETCAKPNSEPSSGSSTVPNTAIRKKTNDKTTGTSKATTNTTSSKNKKKKKNQDRSRFKFM